MLKLSTYEQTNAAVLFDGAAIIPIHHSSFGGQNESAFRNKIWQVTVAFFHKDGADWISAQLLCRVIFRSKHFTDFTVNLLTTTLSELLAAEQRRGTSHSSRTGSDALLH